jgi:hypothetical protein
MDALKPLKATTKCSEGCSKSSSYDAITEVILVFECILSYYEQRVKVYMPVNYNAHDEAPKSYLTINLRVA